MVIGCLFFSLLNLFGNWEPFTPLNHHFVVMLPGIPQYKEAKISTSIGEVSQMKFSLEALDLGQRFQFELVETEYPVDVILDDSTGLSIAAAIREDMIKQLTALEIYSQGDTKDAIGQTIFLLKYNETESVKCQCFWKDNRFYTLCAYTPYKNRLNPFVERFFGSFQIL